MLEVDQVGSGRVARLHCRGEVLLLRCCVSLSTCLASCALAGRGEGVAGVCGTSFAPSSLLREFGRQQSYGSVPGRGNMHFWLVFLSVRDWRRGKQLL